MDDILDLLYDGAATVKDLSVELQASPSYVSRTLEEAFYVGLVTRKAFQRYKAPVYIYELARTKKTVA